VGKNDLLESLILKRNNTIIFWQILVICFLVCFSALLVFFTGGLKYVFSHTMYIPILIASFAFDVWGGFFVALAGGLLLGPFMPLDVANGLMQTPSNWVYRCIIFILIGLLQGSISAYLKKRFLSKKWADTHNPDTGMDNQVALQTALESLPATHKSDELCCLAVIQISNYDSILSTFGKKVADKCMSAVAKAIEDQRHIPGLYGFQILRETLCYFYVGKFPTSEEIQEKIREFTESLIVIDDIPYYLDIHMGTASHCIGDLDPSSLLNQAQIASHVAFQENRFYRYFNNEFEMLTKRNLAIVGSVLQAKQKNQFFLVFQPILEYATEKIVGVEALLRWDSPTLGSLSPVVFIPLVENTPLIEIVQNWVLEEAFTKIEQLNKEFPDLYCSINLSANTLHDAKLVLQVQSLLTEKKVQSSNIIFEVTETAIMESPDKALQTLLKLKDLGCRLSIDDFGTGLSSFTYLENIPADVIKIDKIFIDKISYSEHTRILLKGIIELSRNIGLEVVAEGVDTLEKIEFMKAIQCDYLQGFYYAKPLTYEQLVPWIRENKKELA
jgi:EAL domain-containing protein (putative c-di-GMP-specific phosphodiesterase class I)/GGDEF domain-containing protein